MKYRILFPQEPFDKKNVDSAYFEEYNTCKLMGIHTYLFDFDKFIEEGKLSSNINMEDDCILIYRGWMMKPEQYMDLFDKIMDMSNGKIEPLNKSLHYQYCHCFPQIYNYIKDYTPRIVLVDNYNNTLMDYKSVLKNIDFDFFIKDHVKSVKTDKGVEKIDHKMITCVDFMNKIKEFVDERGNLFTGGIVLKEFVNLKKINDKTNEWRIFVLNGKVLCTMQNSNLITDVQPSSKLISSVIDCIGYRSKFYTIDFAQLEDDSWTVIETGDGGVSGFPDNFNPIGFYNKLIQS